ncbi:thiol reductant ABC exporter subunit CydD [Roseibium sp. RKSG952]|uniref:thiol reductant ABC exporter subunit CydD n=1 Tax=Roseibium sp. RKSG952 TaxID=2529384 RepID=UPI0012BBA23B|nr:thiol reductant ABC exporter subunit CydD [Roseibium sp. RKSG952]MTH97571.1 thiol reductant ABC exporter subunit CydD [Roseibium sp. RKSG952]
MKQAAKERAGFQGQAAAAPDASTVLLKSDERKALKRAGLLLCFSDICWLPQAGLVAYAVAMLLSSVASTGTNALAAWELVACALGFLGIGAVRAVLQNVSGKLARRTADTVKTRKRAELLDAVTSASPASDLPGSGRIAAHISEQVDALGPYLANFMPQQQRLKIVPLVMLLATLPVSWLAAAILLVTGPMIPVMMALIGMGAKAASEKQQDELTRMSGVLLDKVRGLQTLRLFGALKETETEISEVGERFRNGTMDVLKIAFLSSTVLELFSAIGIAFVAVYVGFSLIGDISFGTWTSVLSFGPGLFILLLAPEFFAPLRSYAIAYHDRAAGLAAHGKLNELAAELYAAGHNLRETGEARINQMSEGAGHPGAPEIVFRQVRVGRSDAPRVAGISFRVEAGQPVILRGRSGSGKTTLIDCLLGFVAPDAGELLINGSPRSDLSREEWRRSLAWLGQEPRLFHGSILANLRLANAQATEADIAAALRLAGAEAFVRRLPKGLRTVIGEDGFGLSVGEGRRLALARAALRQEATLLLADEPTAGLDDETAADVIEGLKQLAAGRTTLVASHDPRLFELDWRQIDLAGCRKAEAVA